MICSYLPGERRFRSAVHRVLGVPCCDELDYWRGLALCWGTATLINVEHDMQCSDELIDALLSCPEPLCTHAYRIHHAGGHYAHRVGRNAVYGGEWLRAPEEYAEFSGIGFCKLALAARARPLRQARWDALEIAVAQAIEGRWHVHWPEIEHFHR